MAKDTTFEDLGFEESFEDLGFEPEQPKVESVSDIPSSAKSFQKGVEQGTTFGFSDEIAGGVQALLDIMNGGQVAETNRKLKEQGFTGDIGPTSTGELYDLARNEEREEIKSAENANPGMFFAGNVAGGVLPALGTGGGVLIAKAPSTFSKVAGGLKLGALSGAATGAGMSEGETLGEIAGDAATMGLVGGGIGGALGMAPVAAKTVKGWGKEIAEMPFMEKLSKSFNLGLKGEKITGKKNAERILDEYLNTAGAVGAKNKELFRQLSEDIQNAKVNADKLGIDIDKYLEIVIKKIEALPEISPLEEKVKNDLRTTILNKVKGKEVTKEVSAPMTKISSGPIKTVAAKPSSTQKLQDEAAKLTEKARLEGENAVFEVIETTGADGKKYSNLVKRTQDISSEQPERLIPEFNSDGEIAGYGLQRPTGSKTSSVQIPDGPGGAIKTVSIVPTSKQKLLSVTEPKVPGEPQYLSGTGIKEGIKVKTVPFEDAIPEQAIAGEQIVEPGFITGKITTREGGGVRTVKDVNELKTAITPWTEVGEQAKETDAARRTATDIASTLKRIVGNVDENLTKANEEFSNAMKASKLIKQDKAVGIDEVLSNESDLAKLVLKSGDLTVEGRAANKALDIVKDILGRSNKPQAKRVVANIKQLEKKVDTVGLVQEVSEEGTYRPLGTPKQLGIGGANWLGRQVNTAGKGISQTYDELLPEVIRNTLRNTSSKASQYVGTALAKAAEKPQVARDASLFALEQYPAFRDIIKRNGGSRE